MTSYDELERRLIYHRKGRIEETMLRGLLQSYSCTLHRQEPLGGGISHHYYMVRLRLRLRLRQHRARARQRKR